MTNEIREIDGQERMEITPDFLGESRHEFVRLRAYLHWEERGMPLGSPEVDWFAAERAFYESLVASGLISPPANYERDMEQLIYHE